jgi:hypothetical protein
MNILKSILLFQILLLLGSCSSGNASGFSGSTEKGGERSEITKAGALKLSPVEYAAWVENKENGLKVEKTISDFTYTLQYKPLEYVALLELKKQEVSKAELKNTMEQFSGLQYYTFQISADTQDELLKMNLSEKNEYYSRIQYFSFDMQKDLKLIDGKDTLDCALFHFERVYGIAPFARFVIGFPTTNGTNDKTLFYDEKIFGSGKVYLTIQAKNNNQLPAVITNEHETK